MSLRKMIPDLCSRVSFFPKLNSELYGAEKYEILGIDYAESSYISELPLMQMADLEIIRYFFHFVAQFFERTGNIVFCGADIGMS